MFRRPVLLSYLGYEQLSGSHIVLAASVDQRRAGCISVVCSMESSRNDYSAFNWDLHSCIRAPELGTWHQDRDSCSSGIGKQAYRVAANHTIDFQETQTSGTSLIHNHSRTVKRHTLV